MTAESHKIPWECYEHGEAQLLCGITGDTLYCGICQKIDKAVAAETERCINAVCRDCAEGKPLVGTGLGFHIHKSGSHFMDCRAAAIRDTPK